MKVLVVALVFLGVALSMQNIPTGFDSIDKKELFKGWQATYKKTYSSLEEEAKRFKIFSANAKAIFEWNMQPNTNYTLALNQFGDLTSDEFRIYVHGHKESCLLKKPKNVKKIEKLDDKVKATQDSVDWRTKGVVTAVKNQGQCGSCWAFSTTGSIESRYAIAHGVLTSLSEQELVDCSGSYGNLGCNGGLMDNGFRYVRDNGGLCSESEYPYQAQTLSCRKSQCSTRYNAISSYADVTTDSEESLKAAVAQGPVSIAIEADQFAFQFYAGGVLDGSCGTKLDHGVLIVGYGTDGQDYWIVKNSWGETWGESGYVRICRNCGKNAGAGECGLLKQPSYPFA